MDTERRGRLSLTYLSHFKLDSGNFAFNVNATVGLPSVSDLSVGLDLWTAQYDNGSVTTPPAGAPTTTVVKSGSCTLGVPFGMRFLNGYNYALVQFSTNWNKTDTVDQSMWHVYLYDKFKFASILPGGTWTAITASVTSPHRSTLTSTDTITTGTIGILNRFDVPVVDGVTLALIPQVSLSETATFDAPATGSTSSSFNTALDIGMAMAVKATIPGTPITLSAGIKPIATINLIGSSSTTIVGAFTSTVNSFDNSIGYAANNNALFCITVAFPEDVSMDLEVVNANTYAFECVIPLKPSPAPEPKAAPARKQAAKETPKKAEKPAAQPASQAAAKPANKAAPKKN